MSLYANGEINGVVVDLGNRMQIMPVVEGFSLDFACVQLPTGLGDLTEYLAFLLTERGYYFRTAKEMEEVRKIKEKYCYVALNFEEEMQKPLSEIEVKYPSCDIRDYVGLHFQYDLQYTSCLRFYTYTS
jgi:actin-related protein